jgi:Zn-finger domain-containing protein
MSKPSPGLPIGQDVRFARKDIKIQQDKASKAGFQKQSKRLTAGFRRNDKFGFS